MSLLINIESLYTENCLHVPYCSHSNSSTNRTRIRRAISAAAARFFEICMHLMHQISAPFAFYHLFSPRKRYASPLLIFRFYVHSETHGRSCKKIKEKAIRSIGGSFSCRSRSMAHEVADTHTHMCTQHTYADCVLDSRLYLFYFRVSFSSFLNFFLSNRYCT